METTTRYIATIFRRIESMINVYSKFIFIILKIANLLNPKSVLFNLTSLWLLIVQINAFTLTYYSISFS